MLTIWTLDNVRRHRSFYSEFDFLMLFASVTLWKRNQPEAYCVLYCDPMTYRALTFAQATHLWDEIRELPENKFVDKKVFWSISKLQALREVDQPVVLMDGDFLAYRNLVHLFEDKIIVTHDENGKGYYPNALDKYVKQTKHIIPRPNGMAVNCAFQYFPDPAFARSYASMSILLMEEFTTLGAPDSNYLLYAEQLALKHLLDSKKIDYETLVDEVWMVKDGIFEEEKSDRGIIPFEEQRVWFRHYWMDKSFIRMNQEGFSLKEEINELKRILAKDKTIDFKSLKTINEHIK